MSRTGLIVATLIALGALALPAASLADERLERRLSELMDRAGGASGIWVYDAANRRRLFADAAGKRRIPASNQKLFTTSAILHRLGEDARLRTEVRADGVLDGRVLRGDLYLVGDGDPSLGSSELRALAKQVKRSGIRRVKGRVFADDSIFDRKRGVPDSGYGPSPYIAPLSGLVYAGSTYSGDPALEAAGAFRRYLRKRGVKAGRVKLGRAPKRALRRAPLASVASPPVGALVEATNEPSNNFFAEMLLKRLVATPSRRGTTKAGTRAVERFARSKGSRISARDGSGLTDGNRAAPRDVVRLLVAMREHRDGEAFVDSLPVAGKEGTVDERMEGTAAAGRCRAKTGTIDGVSALSGYCQAGHGRVAFSLLMNGVGDYDAARRIQDKMTVKIARYRP